MGTAIIVAGLLIGVTILIAAAWIVSQLENIERGVVRAAEAQERQVMVLGGITQELRDISVDLGRANRAQGIYDD